MEDWMANMSERLKKMPITELMLPASHDSCARQILNVKVSTEGFTYWANAFSWLPCVEHFSERWTETQELTTTQQLELGIRGFDWRVSIALNEDDFYFSHSFAVEKASLVIKEVADFLNAHPGEVVYILGKADSRNNMNWTQVLSNRFAGLVYGNLSQWLVPTSTQDLTVQSLVDNNHRLFFFWSGQIDDNQYTWRQPWGMIQQDYTTVESKLERAEEFLHSLSKNPDAVNILALTLTPTDDSIRAAITYQLWYPWANQTSLRTWTEDMHAAMYKWLDTQPREQLDKLRILTTDFVDETFVKWVINYNETRN